MIGEPIIFSPRNITRALHLPTMDYPKVRVGLGLGRENTTSRFLPAKILACATRDSAFLVNRAPGTQYMRPRCRISHSAIQHARTRYGGLHGASSTLSRFRVDPSSPMERFTMSGSCRGFVAFSYPGSGACCTTLEVLGRTGSTCNGLFLPCFPLF